MGGGYVLCKAHDYHHSPTTTPAKPVHQTYFQTLDASLLHARTFVHVDVQHLSTILHLHLSDRERFVKLAFLDQPARITEMTDKFERSYG